MFHIDHRWKLARVGGNGRQKIIRLNGTRFTNTKEMIGANNQPCSFGILPIPLKMGINKITAFSRLDIGKADVRRGKL